MKTFSEFRESNNLRHAQGNGLKGNLRYSGSAAYTSPVKSFPSSKQTTKPNVSTSDFELLKDIGSKHKTNEFNGVTFGSLFSFGATASEKAKIRASIKKLEKADLVSVRSENRGGAVKIIYPKD